MSFAVIVAAAGKSTRFGDPTTKKPFVELEGVPIWKRSLDALRSHADVSQSIVVVSAEDIDWFCETNASVLDEIDVVAGGSSRAESVGNGLAAVRDARFVAVHDAARPLVEVASVASVFDAAKQWGAAILATRVASTVKRADGNMITETVSRDSLWLAQTPQVGRREMFTQAYADRAGAAWTPVDPTDEAQLLERCGHKVRIVESPSTNIKITTQDDLHIARALLASREQTDV